MDWLLKAIVLFLVEKNFIATLAKSALHDRECPIWHYYNSTSGSCQCGDILNGVVACHNSGRVSIKACYCMSVDSTGEAVVAACPYTCYYFYAKTGSISKLLEENLTTQLDEATCGIYNRKGFLCGECKSSYGIPTYSYSIHCKKCSNYEHDWMKYIAIAYLPLTVFYFLIITFQISANSGLMIGYVIISQMAGTTNVNAMYILTNPKSYKHVVKSLVMLYSVWNLDFFRSYCPPFCLGPRWTALQLLSLDYIIAVYPIFLVLLTYVTVQLYSYNCPLVAILCKPIYIGLHYVRKEWNVSSSLTDALATLIILSYNRILNVSSNILTPNFPYYMNGSYGAPVLYEDPTTLYLSSRHLPYFFLAIMMTVIFNILPLLILLLYPTHCFQKYINKLQINHRLLYTLMDAFQGSFKLRPRLLRSFSAVFLLAQIANLGSFMFLGYPQYHPAALYILVIVISLLAICKPFKAKSHNYVNIALFFSIALTYYIAIIQLEEKYISRISSHDVWLTTNRYLMYLCGLIPPLYGFSLFLYKALPVQVKEFFVLCWTNSTFVKVGSNTDDEENLPSYRHYANEQQPLLDPVMN